MLFDINIGLFFGITFPPLIYTLIIYLTSPYGSISIKKALYYLIGGVFSTTFVYFISSFIEMSAFNSFMKHFFIVGPREELSKILAFIIIAKGISDNTRHPVATMFYMGMIGLGFAMYENLLYAHRYGDMVLLSRSFSSTLGHMIFGMFFGYWCGLSQLESGAYGGRSVFGFFIKKYKNLRKWIYGIIGFICASSFHGLWNYNLSNYTSSTMPIMVLMVIIGLITCKFAASDLNNHYRLSLKSKIPKIKSVPPINKEKEQWLKGEGPQTD